MYMLYTFLLGFLSFPVIIYISLYLWYLSLPHFEPSNKNSLEYKISTLLKSFLAIAIPYYRNLSSLINELLFDPKNFEAHIQSDFAHVADKENITAYSIIKSIAEPQDHDFKSFATTSSSTLNDYNDLDEIFSGWLFITTPEQIEKHKKKSMLSSYLPKNVSKILNTKKSNETSSASSFGITELSNTASDIEKNIFKASSLYYVVLKNRSLYLYKDISKAEGLGVIILSEYSASLMTADNYSEARIYSKKLPIILNYNNHNKSQATEYNSKDINAKDTPKQSSCSENQNIAYYIFAKHSVNKEDWYFEITKAILENGSKKDQNVFNDCYKLDWDQVIENVKSSLHKTEPSSDKNILADTLLNLIIGRIFLGLIKTNNAHSYATKKLQKKFTKMSFPSIISNIEILNIDLGSKVPTLFNTRILDIGLNGQVKLQSDFNYSGKIYVLLKIVIKLVNISFPVTVKLQINEISGVLHIYIKNPPSNRIWVGFETMPKIDLILEPTIMQKQIKTKKIIAILKSKILNNFKSSYVLPNMTDFLFYNPSECGFGGIMQSEIVNKFNNLKKNSNLDANINSRSNNNVEMDLAQSGKLDSSSENLHIFDDSFSTINEELDNLSSPKIQKPIDALQMDLRQSEIIKQEMLNNSKKQHISPLKLNSIKKWSMESVVEPNKRGSVSSLDSVLLSNEDTKLSSSSVDERNDPVFNNKNLSKIQLNNKKANDLESSSTLRQPTPGEIFQRNPSNQSDQASKNQIISDNSSNIKYKNNYGVNKTLNLMGYLGNSTMSNDCLAQSPKKPNLTQNETNGFSFNRVFTSTLSKTMSSQTGELSKNELKFISKSEKTAPSYTLSSVSSDAKNIGSTIKSSVISSASELYKTANQSKTVSSVKKWLPKSIQSKKSNPDFISNTNIKTNSVIEEKPMPLYSIKTSTGSQKNSKPISSLEANGKINTDYNERIGDKMVSSDKALKKNLDTSDSEKNSNNSEPINADNLVEDLVYSNEKVNNSHKLPKVKLQSHSNDFYLLENQVPFLKEPPKLPSRNHEIHVKSSINSTSKEQHFADKSSSAEFYVISDINNLSDSRIEKNKLKLSEIPRTAAAGVPYHSAKRTRLEYSTVAKTSLIDPQNLQEFAEVSIIHLIDNSNPKALKKACYDGSDTKIGCSWTQFSGNINAAIDYVALKTDDKY
ncbi:hypothetical protein BB561_006660, partial [Smittium simulii]